MSTKSVGPTATALRRMSILSTVYNWPALLVVTAPALITFALLSWYANSIAATDRQLLDRWLDRTGRLVPQDVDIELIKRILHESGVDSLVHCAQLSTGERPLPKKISKAVGRQLIVWAAILQDQLVLKQWLDEQARLGPHIVERLVEKVQTLDQVPVYAGSDESLRHLTADVVDGDVRAWRNAVSDLPTRTNSAASFVKLKKALWEEHVRAYRKQEWSFGGVLVFSVFIALLAASLKSMSLALRVDGQLAKRSLFEYVTGKYLVPQKVQVFFNWKEPCVVGSIMSFTVKFYQRNGRPYPICNRDHILVEICTEGSNLKVASSVEVGSPDPTLANALFVKFAVRKAGEYSIAITIANNHVKGSPFIKEFLPGPPDPLKTGFVHHCSTIVCTERVAHHLIVESRDEYGNLCTFPVDSDPTEGYVATVYKTGTKEPLKAAASVFEYRAASRQVVLQLKLEQQGCYRAMVTYNKVAIRNGDFNVIVLDNHDASIVQKNVEKKNQNIWYTCTLLSCNGERLNKPKKVHCYLSPKQLTIKEFFLKFIPKRLFTFRLCPSTKFQFFGHDDESEFPRLVIDDGCQPKVELATRDGNVIAATFTHYLLKNIGGSETFKDKRDFFYHEVRQFHRKRGHDRLPIRVQRDQILHSSVKSTKGFTVSDWCKNFEVNFHGEQGLDWGGVRREWFELLCSALFNTSNQLFTRFKDDKQGLVHPNADRPSDLKLKCYEFAGKIVGKCLYESALGGTYRQLVKARFSRSFLAQVIGLRVHFKYFEQDDPDLYVAKIKYILENDVDDMDLFFVEEVYRAGQLIEVIELISNGARTKVTNLNKLQYLDALAQHRLANSVRDETESFLRGLNELIPDSLLSIFDENELELLMCGTSQFSVADFKANHVVSGSSYEFRKVLVWFWTAVSNFTDEEMARLLQFTTGCSQLPASGFSELCPRFQIIASPTFGSLPTAHTCFNQLCLPDYDSYEQFEKALLLAISEGTEGFGMI